MPDAGRTGEGEIARAGKHGVHIEETSASAVHIASEEQQSSK